VLSLHKAMPESVAPWSRPDGRPGVTCPGSATAPVEPSAPAWAPLLSSALVGHRAEVVARNRLALPISALSGLTGGQPLRNVAHERAAVVDELVFSAL
jgi:hypothetical protein